jgi:alpha-tubulin suppressor-like RCC1 family protein
LFGVGYGIIGDGSLSSLKIKQIDYFSNIFIVDVACGQNHCLSITDKGEIFGWGDSEFGKIGNGKIGKEEQLTPIKIFTI